MRLFSRSFLLFALLTLGACAVQSPPVREAAPVELPEAWRGTPDGSPLVPWLSDFGSAALDQLVGEAVANNFDLQAAAARLAAARADARIAGADRLPAVDASFAASRAKRTPSDRTGFSGRTTDAFRLTGELSWEADLWNRLASRTRAAIADAEADAWDYQAGRLSLAASVSRRWFDAIEALQQLRLAEQTVESFQRSLTITEERYRRGIGSALDVRLARNNLANAEGNRQRRTREQRALLRTIETLLGRYPDTALAVPGVLPQPADKVPAGLPLDLLRRRPDVLAAERRLLAAEQRHLDARRNRLPSVALTASGGTASEELRDLIDLDFLIWSIAGSLAQPIFQGGRLEAERDRAAARQQAAYFDYAQQLILALEEVETALDGDDYLAEQQSALAVSAKEAAAAEDLALDEYQRGLTEIITLLEAQRRAFNAQSALLSVSNERLQNRINLYLALGGDFAEGADE
jgi:NodT family efflux transporter outer membrane factor (OMF) lipoprotein